jgi:hypothetical protein
MQIDTWRRLLTRNLKNAKLWIRRQKYKNLLRHRHLHSKSFASRQSLTKSIVKASDLLLADKSKSLSNDESVKLVKVIKRAGEILCKI